MNRFLSLFCTPVLLLGGSLSIHITYSGETMMSLRTITQAFNAIGYKLEIDSLKVQMNSGEFNATAIGNRSFSAEALDENLKAEKIQIEKANSDETGVVLVLDTQSALWDVPLLEGEGGLELKRVSAAQWFRVDNAKNIRIQPPYVGKWYPDIAIFDRSMHLLSSSRSTESKEEFQVELPPDAYYLKISNTQGMKVLKEGMWIESMTAAQ